MDGMEIPQWLLGCSPLIFIFASCYRESEDIGPIMKNIVLPVIMFLSLCGMVKCLAEWLL